MTMKLSDLGLLEICEHEGIVPAPYRDSRGVWTYGIGHTAAAGGLDPQEMYGAMPADIDAAIDRAVGIFRTDVEKYEGRIRAAFPVPLEQHQFDALVSWDFNTGGATWRHRTTRQPCQLVQQVNRGDMTGTGFMGWLKPAEIRGRRQAERNLFLTGDYAANGDRIAVWKTDGRGRLNGVLKTIPGSDVLARLRPAIDGGWPEPGERFADGDWAARFMRWLLR